MYILVRSDVNDRANRPWLAVTVPRDPEQGQGLIDCVRRAIQMVVG
jgi:hypothetical protein